MKVLHPDKEKYLNIEALKDECYTEGVYKIIAKEEAPRLSSFLKCFSDYRHKKQEKITDVALYENLPFSINSNSWKAKQKDVKIINKYIKGKENLKILDIGCWNGWLCNYLSKKGHTLVGIDIFEDEYDGLKALKHYSSKFTCLQLDTNQIYRIKDQFDLIIFNRNWAYFTNPYKTINDAKSLLKINGTILITGLQFFKSSQKNNVLEKENTMFINNYNIPLLFHDTKGFLTKKDRQLFKTNAIKIKPYHKLKYIIKKTIGNRFKNEYAIYENVKKS